MSVPTSLDRSNALIPDAARLFIGLWPGPAVRARLSALAQQWRWSPHAQRVAEPRQHLTLHFLGDVPRWRLPDVSAGLAVAMQPFDLVLDRAEIWRNGVATLCPADLPEPLSVLQQALAHALVRLGLPPENRSFRPHVTMARRAEGSQVPPQGFAPVRWRISGYTLVESRLLEAGAEYRSLRHYPAAAPAQAQGQPADSQPADWNDQLQSGPIPF